MLLFPLAIIFLNIWQISEQNSSKHLNGSKHSSKSGNANQSVGSLKSIRLSSAPTGRVFKKSTKKSAEIFKPTAGNAHHQNLAIKQRTASASAKVHVSSAANKESHHSQKGVFLEFQPETPKEASEKFDENATCKCGTHLLRDMKEIKYGNWHFRVWPKPISQGSTSKVFHAHPMAELTDFEGKSLNLKDCVALKAVLIDETMHKLKNEMRNEIEILKLFAKKDSKRVIRLFADKEITETHFLFLLEMGENDLREEFRKIQKWIYKSNNNAEIIVKETLTKILEAVKEMHKDVIHLDLKPENMLFVDEGGQRTLKVIDFGGSELIPESSAVEVNKRANVCKTRLHMWRTERYSSPEQLCGTSSGKYHVSIKSDIWAVGIMLLEMVLMDPNLWDESIKGAINIFESLFNFYHSPETHYTNAVGKIIHQAHNRFPELYDIVTASLDIKPTERTTARGLLKYLLKKCHLILPGEMNIKSHNDEKPYCDRETTASPPASKEGKNSSNDESTKVKVGGKFDAKRFY